MPRKSSCSKCRLQILGFLIFVPALPITTKAFSTRGDWASFNAIELSGVVYPMIRSRNGCLFEFMSVYVLSVEGLVSMYPGKGKGSWVKKGVHFLKCKELCQKDTRVKVWMIFQW